MSDLGSFSALEISATGLTAQRLRMNVVANNIANASTTRTPEGGPYKRQVVSFQAALNGPVIAIPGNDPAAPHLSLSTRSPGQRTLSLASSASRCCPPASRWAR